MDVIEIDGASNRGIDEIRDLRENIKLSPIHGKYKIYIIDEVHQITEAAFNALLKTLEEPPPHVKFIFATTQPHKIPSTILSRCQRFDFKRIPIAQIVEKLKAIAVLEKINASEEVFFEIARASDGSLRDAESILDQLNSFCEKKIEIKDVTRVLGVIEEGLLFDLTGLIAKKDTAGILKAIDELINDGKDMFQFLLRLIEHIRDITVIKINKKAAASMGLSDDITAKLTAQGAVFSLEDLIYFFYLLSAAYESARKTGFIRFSLEFALIRIVRREGALSISELLEKVNSAKIEERPISAPAEAPIAQPVTPAAPHIAPGEDISGILQQVIGKLGEKKASLASFLMEGNAVSLDDGHIRISFPKIYQFHKEILEGADNKKMIEEIFSDILAKKIKIEFILVPNHEHKNNNKPRVADPVVEEKEDPSLKSALEVFKGSVIRSHKNPGN